MEYRGELASSGPGGGPRDLGSGFRGVWSIRHRLGDLDGRFHVWPAMEGWRGPTGAAAGSDGAALDGAVPQRAFDVESECVVCFESRIDTTLSPCGHRVLCRDCANRLRSRVCPICRTGISFVSDIIVRG